MEKPPLRQADFRFRRIVSYERRGGSRTVRDGAIVHRRVGEPALLAGLLGLFFHLIGDRPGPRETDHEHRRNYWPCHREPIAVRRLSTETKAAFKTTEFVAYVAVLVGLLVARAAVA